MGFLQARGYRELDKGSKNITFIDYGSAAVPFCGSLFPH